MRFLRSLYFLITVAIVSLGVATVIWWDTLFFLARRLGVMQSTTLLVGLLVCAGAALLRRRSHPSKPQLTAAPMPALAWPEQVSVPVAPPNFTAAYQERRVRVAEQIAVLAMRAAEVPAAGDTVLSGEGDAILGHCNQATVSPEIRSAASGATDAEGAGLVPAAGDTVLSGEGDAVLGHCNQATVSPEIRSVASGAAGAEAEARERVVLQHLLIVSATGARPVGISEATGVPRRTLTRLLRRLQLWSFVAQSAPAQPYIITPKGQRYAAQLGIEIPKNSESVEGETNG